MNIDKYKEKINELEKIKHSAELHNNDILRLSSVRFRLKSGSDRYKVQVSYKTEKNQAKTDRRWNTVLSVHKAERGGGLTKDDMDELVESMNQGFDYISQHFIEKIVSGREKCIESLKKIINA